MFSFQCFEVCQLLVSIWEKLVEVLVGVEDDLGQWPLLLFCWCRSQLSNGLVRQSNRISPIVEKIVVVVVVTVAVDVVGRDGWSDCWLFRLLIDAVGWCCCCCTIGRRRGRWGSCVSRRTWRTWRCWRREARLIPTWEWGWLGVDNRYRSHCLERERERQNLNVIFIFLRKKISDPKYPFNVKARGAHFLSILSKHWSNIFFRKIISRKKVESLTRGNWYYITTARNKMT